ncbi:MAG: glycosyltransferase family 9 protein [Planctomycetes bacterium]|nr:glycosyltransferase family 9 protein [Planctomycetota bacterium]
MSGHRAIDRFLLFDARDRSRWRPFLAELRAQRFELVIDLQRILKSGVITRASGAPHRLGFDRARCKEGSWLFTNAKVPPNASPGVTVAQYLEFADFLECPPAAPSWELPFEPFPRSAPGRPRVIVNVGATKLANRWYADAWARVCDALVREFDAEVHLTGGPSDRDETAEVARLASVPLVDQAGKLSLKQSAGLIASARLFIGCDTGPLHIAAAVGTPCVALFGAADPRRTGPFGPEHAVVTHPVACSPCRRRECNVAGHPCMADLAPERVLERARAALAAP